MRRLIDVGSAIDSVISERERQDELWKRQDHTQFRWGMILGDTYGSYCKGVIAQDSPSFPSSLNVRDELVKLAAIAIAAIECIDKEKIEL